MALGETAELAVRLTLDDKFSRGLRGATGSLGRFEGSIRRVGRGTGQLTAGLTRVGALAGTVAAGGLIGAAKAAIDFEDAFAGVRKTVDEADLAAAGLSFDTLSRSFRDMATEIPIAATEFARLGETAGALGVEAGAIQKFVETTALLGVTTDLTADQAADSLGRIGTILDFTADDYTKFADSLVALGNAGASTESEIIEIAKRFAGQGEAVGLLTDQIAGLASVTASLGFAPERGGTALARVFANMSTNIALANDKGKEFSRLVGRPISDLQNELDRGEGLPIFLDFLKGIENLSATDAARVLKAAGITNTSDRTLFQNMAENLPEVTRQLEVAANATGALSTEATKRFDTVASKIALFKNNLVEAGITIGEGMIPAIGRATEKLSEFLKAPGGKSELKALGEDIGNAIDSINWQEVISGGREVVGLLKTGAGFAKTLLDAFMALPGEFKAATAGLLILNKASGGLVGAGLGNIAGGIGEAVTRGLGSRLPKVGGLFAQPVFVTNWPLGGLGGGPGGAGGGGGIAGNLLKATVIGAIVAAAVNEVDKARNDPAAKAAQINRISSGGGGAQFGPRSFANLEAYTRQTAENTRPAYTQSRVAYLGQQVKIAANYSANQASIASRENANRTSTALQNVRASVMGVNQQVVAMRTATMTQLIGQKAAIAAQTVGDMVGRAGQAMRDFSQTNAIRTGAYQTTAATRGVQAATNSGASRIVAAIWAARPVINTTTIQQRTTITNSYGPTGGSSTTNRIPGSGR